MFPNSVFALVTWSFAFEDEDPINPVAGFTLGYRRDRSQLSDNDMLLKDMTPYKWNWISDIRANETTRTVYGLDPATTYYFRICAFNRLGCGEVVNLMIKTKNDRNEVEMSSLAANSTSNPGSLVR